MLRTDTYFGILVLLLLGVAQAASGSALLSVEANPNPAAPNQDVTVTATRGGSQNCGWKVVFGDGNTSPAMGFATTPKNVVHSYASAGTYTIQITGASHGTKPNCTSSATTQLVVQTSNGGGNIEIGPALDLPLKPKGPKVSVGELCAKIDCKGLIQKPVIEKRFGFGKPGGVMAWIGKGFGPTTGVVSLRYRRFDGSYQTANLEILEWTPTMVGTKIPASLTGYLHQQASVRVKTPDGWESASYSFDLAPEMDWIELDQDDVKVVHCGFDGNADRCNGVHEGNDAVFGYFSSTSQGAAIEGFHGNAWGTVGDDKGNDSYEVSLKNGWTIASGSTWKKLSSSNEKVNGPSPGAPVGQSYWKPSYAWVASSGNDTVQYATFIVITGPRGVPFK